MFVNVDKLNVFIPRCEKTGYYLLNAVAATHKECYKICASQLEDMSGISIKEAILTIERSKND